MAKRINYASMFTLRADGRYMGYWHDPDGRRHAIYDRDPEALYHKIETRENPVQAPPTFREIAEAWQAEHWERINYKTAEAYTAPLRRLIDQWGDEDAAAVTAQRVNAYLNDLAKQKYARRTVQMHRDIVNMIYNHAIVQGTAAVNPCAAVALPRNLPATRRELPEDAAVEAVKSSSVPFALFAKFCLYAGLRRGEALALRFEDVDRQQGVIHVTKAVEYVGNDPHIKPPKTEAARRDAILLDVLAAQIPQKGKGLIFPRADGQQHPLTKSSFRKRWAAYCRAIGYDITPHQLRHGFATILYEAGVPDKDAQELLGHSSITVTRDVYTHIRQTRRADTAARLNAFVDNNTF